MCSYKCYFACRAERALRGLFTICITKGKDKARVQRVKCVYVRGLCSELVSSASLISDLTCVRLDQGMLFS